MDKILDFKELQGKKEVKESVKEELINLLSALTSKVQAAIDAGANNKASIVSAVEAEQSAVMKFLADNEISQDFLNSVVKDTPGLSENVKIKVMSGSDVESVADLFIDTFADRIEVKRDIHYCIDNDKNKCRIICCGNEIFVLSEGQLDKNDEAFDEFINLYSMMFGLETYIVVAESPKVFTRAAVRS